MIVDTGILYALADADDAHHAQAKAIFLGREPRIVPEPVVVEADWMILARAGVDAEIAFLSGLAQLVVEQPTRADRRRAAELAASYRDAELGYVDAVVIAIAERLKEKRIATVDRRHFALVRPRHVEAFEIVP